MSKKKRRRGESGGWGNAAGAGVFALSLDYAPSHSATSIGARCCAGGR